MQTRPTCRLVQKMARYARKHSRRQVAEKFGIVDPHGQPSKGLVKMLLDGYEPIKPETRIRLGLPPELPKPVHHRTIDEHLATDPIQDMPAPLLRWALENRHEMDSSSN